VQEIVIFLVSIRRRLSTALIKDPAKVMVTLSTLAYPLLQVSGLYPTFTATTTIIIAIVITELRQCLLLYKTRLTDLHHPPFLDFITFLIHLAIRHPTRTLEVFTVPLALDADQRLSWDLHL
jgi:hypothetical protein